jgi:predicted small secreted protein
MKIKLLIAAAFTLAGCASMDAQGPMFEKVMLS